MYRDNNEKLISLNTVIEKMTEVQDNFESLKIEC